MTTDHYNSPLPYRLRQKHSPYVDEAAAEHIEKLEAKLAAIRAKLESIVCTDENFPGVLKLSHKSTVHKETIHGVEFAVCDNEYLSPLGDALIELWQMSSGVVNN